MKQMTRIFSLHGESGFTLIELLVSLAIFGIVLTGVVQMFVLTSGQHTEQEMMVTTTQDLRAAKMLMSQEIREAGLNPQSVSGVGFQLDPGNEAADTDDDSIHFTRDAFRQQGGNWVSGYDGKTDGSDEDIAYYRTNDDCTPGGTVGAVLPVGNATPGCLRRNTGGGGQPVMPNVTNLQFRYFDDATPASEILPANLNSVSNLERIRTVEVLLTAQVQNPGRAPEAAQTMQFRILARNM